MLRALESPDDARRQGSLGLRVLVARSIIEAHGGTIDIVAKESALHVGVTIPTSAPAAPASAPG